MKKYLNPTHDLKTIVFEDGEAQFLMRGQSITTDKPTKSVQSGIVVKEIVDVVKKESEEPVKSTNKTLTRKKQSSEEDKI